MGPGKPLEWIRGMKANLERLDARRSDPYAWLARTDGAIVFFAEIDHVKKEWNRYNHAAGVYEKRVRGMSPAKESAPTLRHSRELFDTARAAHAQNTSCRLLLLKGTKNGTTPGGVKSALDDGIWRVTRVDGSVEQGYEFRLERIKPADS